MLAEGPPSLSLYLLLHLKTQGHDWIITNCGRESEKKKEESGLVDGWMDDGRDWGRERERGREWWLV